jgi:hypothetical protein
LAGGDHHAGSGAAIADGKCRDRRRQNLGSQPHLEALTLQHPRRVPGEHVGVVPPVEGDDHAALASAVDGVDQVVGEARGHALHDHAVHAHRTGAQHTADAGGTELQPPGKPCGQWLATGGDQRLQLGARLRIRVLGKPGPRLRFDAHLGS